jgi:hypothetical protein
MLLLLLPQAQQLSVATKKAVYLVQLCSRSSSSSSS